MERDFFNIELDAVCPPPKSGEGIFNVQLDELSPSPHNIMGRGCG
jgi:hypothetical protein